LQKYAKAYKIMQKPAQVCKSLRKYAKACASIQKPAQVCKSIQKHILSKSKFDDIFFPFFSNFVTTFSRLFKFGTTF
jgi:hypothetical protein